MADRHATVRIDGQPYVRVDPTVRFGRPCIRGISTGVLADVYWVGEAPEVICDEYGITRHELAVALWYEATYGSDRRERHWTDWADAVAYPRLAGWKRPLDIDNLPLPPTGEA